MSNLMKPRFRFLKLNRTFVVIIASILVLADARSFFDDGNQMKGEAFKSSLAPLETTDGQPYGLPSPLALPPLKPPSPVQSPPFTPPSMIPSPNNFPINTPKNRPLSPPTYLPQPSPPQYPVIPPSGAPRPRNQPVAAPPPRHIKPQFAVWCVAKPTVPNTMIQEALDYACGSGADCKSIQPNGRCFQPNTLIAHASYAFNSYWQNSKAAGGTCDFGGTAMLVTSDPSYNNCNFIVK